MNKTIRLLLAAGLLFSIRVMAQEAPQLGKAPLKSVIAAMTLEEKARLVVGTGMRFGPPPTKKDSTNRNAGSNVPVIGATDQRVPGAAGATYAIPRLGIPTIVVADGPAGLRIAPIRNGDSSKTFYATAFPVATLLASSWDTSLVKEVGHAFGHEVHEYGVDILLAPALNIHRNPLGGRNFEYYSEDPLIAGRMTAAIVNGIESNGVGTSIKHFVANNQETNRNTVNTIVSERAMREIYLRGFEIAVKESQPWTVMSSYNKINGTYTSERSDLLTTILRDEWGFNGFVMTDWFGGKDPVEQMKAGNDLLMPGTPQQVQRIIDAVNHDSLSVALLDRNVEKILQVILQSPSFKKYSYSNHPNLKADAAVSRRAASEGMVLLRNSKSALPMNQVKNIALFGNTSYDIIAGGTGSGEVNKAYTVSLVEGLSNAGYHVEEGLRSNYQNYITDAKAKRPRPKNFFEQPAPIPEMKIDPATINQLANSTDVAMITIGRNAGEGADRKQENDYYLSDAEKQLIKYISDAFHAKGKKLVVVLNIGGVIEVASWRDQADAIVLAWQPGLEAGNAIADVLSGKVNPSGKLATTFPMDYKDVPSAKNFPGKELGEAVGTGFMRQVPAEVTYEEGIYVGYRYYNTYNVSPAYEFGYGLSYTNFSYGPLKLSNNQFSGMLTASITVTNSGKVAGKEVVELYLSAPVTKLDKPALELKGFAKTGLLQPGQSQTISLVIGPKDLASYDTQREAWVADAGSYKLQIGSSSKTIRQSANFTLPRELVVEKDHAALKPQTPIVEMKNKVL
ncbi:MAG: glycoside hydrolase family 3 C-terminal domain-containing protein [Flavisolibacter sp.]